MASNLQRLAKCDGFADPASYVPVFLVEAIPRYVHSHNRSRVFHIHQRILGEHDKVTPLARYDRA